MTKIFKVLSNLNHDGTLYPKGTFIEEFAGAQGLVNDGVLKEIEGAENTREAAELDAERTVEATEEEKEQAPENTWEAKKDEEKKDEDTEDTNPKEEEKAGEVYDGSMGFYKVVGEIHPLNEDGTPKEEVLEVGSIHELPKGAVDLETGDWVEATEEEKAEYKKQGETASATVDDAINGDNL